MVELNEKAMEAAIDAAEATYERHEEAGAFVAAVKAAVTVYSSALPAPDGLVEKMVSRAKFQTAIIKLDKMGFYEKTDADLMQEAAAALQSKAEQIERLTRERDEVSSSLEYLLVGYVGRYCDPVPEWQPLPTLGGIISQLDNAMTVTATFKDRAETLEQQVQKLTAENERLREALEPFAKVAEHDIGEGEDDADIFWPISNARYSMAGRLRVGHLRAARSALETQADGQ